MTARTAGTPRTAGTARTARTASAARGPRPAPPLTRSRSPRLPTVADRTLDNGLRVLALRRPGVPLVELRLRVPFAGPSGRRAAAHSAQATLLADTLLSGTTSRDAARLAQDVQALGGQINATTDADRFGLGGSVLASGLPGLLDLVSELLTEAAYPKGDVLAERDRLVQELAIYRSQPGVVAREALLHRMYGRHPYGHDLPEADAVRQVKPAQLRELHARRMAPAGSLLVLVGDLSPARAIGQVEQALAGWQTPAPTTSTPPLPEVVPGPALLVDRPGAVQTTLRMSRPAPSRSDEGYAATVLANLVFGGYFSSRWVANIREDKGYTYSPHSVLEHPPAGSRLLVSADVATAVTAASVVETWHELGRVASVAVGQDELDQARRYAVGALALSTSSQAGLASTVSLLAGAGLGVEWLRDHPRALAAVGVEDVLEAGRRHLGPTGFTAVLVGDADQVADSVRAVVPLETAAPR